MSLTKKRRPSGTGIHLNRLLSGMEKSLLPSNSSNNSYSPSSSASYPYRMLRKRSPLRNVLLLAVLAGTVLGVWILVHSHVADADLIDFVTPDDPNRAQAASLSQHPSSLPSSSSSPVELEEVEEEPPPPPKPRPIEEERPYDIDLWHWINNESPATWFLEVIPKLRDAPPPSTFTCSSSPSFGPLLLIAVFSTARSWEKRDLIRVLGHTGLGQDVENEVQFRFVVGKSQDQAAEKLLNLEMQRHGDIIQLDFPENMDDGKTYQFFRWVGQRPEGERPQFTLKTDDDTFLVLPNLVRSMASLDCSDRIYFGTSWGSCITNCYPFYMRGMAYGLSWPLIRWLTVADMDYEDYRSTEDARTGSWFLSLPPGETIKVLDLGTRLGDYDGESIPINSGTVALHAMKNNWLWAEIGLRLMKAWREEDMEYMFTRRPPAEVRQSEGDDAQDGQ